MKATLISVLVFFAGVVAVAADYGDSVARIIVQNDSRSTSLGSGVLVSVSGSESVVVTNWHVVRPPRKSLSVRWRDGHCHPGVVVAADSTWDLTAIRTRACLGKPVVVSRVPPKRGDRLRIAGHGPGKYLEQQGPVVGFMSPTNLETYQLLELRASARQGDSGGPIFNERGELAGVLFGVHDGLTVGPSCTRVGKFLEDVGLAPEGEKK